MLRKLPVPVLDDTNIKKTHISGVNSKRTLSADSEQEARVGPDPATDFKYNRFGPC